MFQPKKTAPSKHQSRKNLRRARFAWRALAAAESLEPRDLFATDVMLDFDGASKSELVDLGKAVSTTKNLANAGKLLSFVGEFATLQSEYGGYDTFQFLDFNGDATLTRADGELAAQRILTKVTQDFAPYDVNVSRVDDHAAAIKKAAANSAHDTIVIVHGHHLHAGGQALVDANNTTDSGASVSGSVGFAREISARQARGQWSNSRARDAYINGISNAISHEVGHTFGLNHVDTEVHPDSVSLMMPWWRTRDTNFADQWLNTEKGGRQNAHRYLTQVLGASTRPWAAVLTPGVLTIQGNELDNSLAVDQRTDGNWSVRVTTRLGGMTTATSYFVDPVNSPHPNSLNPFSTGIRRINARGGAGDDEIRVSSTLDVPLYAYGGLGNDLLQGGAASDHLYGQSGDDILVGRAGDDELWGDSPFQAAGRDLLIGGIGSDTLRGGPDEDILVNGRTSHDDSTKKLKLIATEWKTWNVVRDFEVLGCHFCSPPEYPETYLNDRTVFNDNVRDHIFATEGDWTVWSPNDVDEPLPPILL